MKRKFRVNFLLGEEDREELTGHLTMNTLITPVRASAAADQPPSQGGKDNAEVPANAMNWDLWPFSLINPIGFLFRTSRFLGIITIIFLTGCAAHINKQNVAAKSAAGDGCTFANPVGKGQDPWVTKKDGYYYYFIESRDGGIYVSKNKKLTDIKEKEKLVWTPPKSGWNHANIWAPELHYINGKWYIYYAAAKEAGSPFIYQRSGVLQAATRDPQGKYIDKGELYTGDDIINRTNDKWAIDLTVSKINNQLYAIWSGWTENESTDKTSQNLYIARMKNPWTISSNRVEISSPTAGWEKGPELDLQEGPEVLKHNEDVFIIYSTQDSWLVTYKLGQLKLMSPTADPMNPANWIKTGPVFRGTSNVFGVGHASFTTSPDGTQNWIVYHSKVDSTPGWNRVIDMKPFGWKRDGSPDFGEPVPPGKQIPVPSGQCNK
ncbi:MAG TPA: glycoside hydrolase family 43 protein [Balneolales bacterium]|nr:glycoside hydrolase family 43 protein [Balneolales bacterium]